MTQTPLVRYGAAVGALCGAALALSEITALTWQTAVPGTIIATIALLDVGVLQVVGVFSAFAHRPRRTIGFVVAATAIAAVTYPSVAGILMRAAFAHGVISWPGLRAMTTGAAVTIVLVIGLAVSATLLWLLGKRGQTERSDAWAVAVLVCVVAVHLLSAAGALHLNPLGSARGLALTLVSCLLLLGAMFALLVACARRPKTTMGTLASAFGLVLLLNAGLPRSSASMLVDAQKRPNVILLVLDTLRADHMSAYGYAQPTTPHLDDLARHAEVFQRAIAPSTWTLPSHASLLTGASARRHGVRERQRPGADGQPARLAREIPTLAEILGGNGYSTAAFVSNCWYLARDVGLARGFSVYDATPRSVAYVRPAFGAVVAAAMPEAYATFIRPFHSASEIDGAALDWLDSHGPAPFFLFLNYMETHWPYEAPREYRQRFARTASTHSDFRVPWDSYQQLTEAVQQQGHHITAAERTALESSYDASLAYLDDQLGEFFTALKQRGLYDGALIIVTSDHGELFGEHDLIGHGEDPYEGAIHVPLLIKRPHAAVQTVIAAPVSTRRVFATILDEVGIAVKAAAADDEPAVVSEVYTAPPRRGEGGGVRVRRAIYQGSLKLIASPDGDTALYDVAGDPAEEHDVSAHHPEARTALLSHLDRWLASENEVTPERSAQPLDPATTEALRALGYIH